MTAAVEPKPEPALERTPVLTGHVKPYASRKCVYCYGKGEAVKLVQSPIADAQGSHTVRMPQLCGCALRRFLKANKNVEVGKDGQLYTVASAGAGEANSGAESDGH